MKNLKEELKNSKKSVSPQALTIYNATSELLKSGFDFFKHYQDYPVLLEILIKHVVLESTMLKRCHKLNVTSSEYVDGYIRALDSIAAILQRIQPGVIDLEPVVVSELFTKLRQLFKHEVDKIKKDFPKEQKENYKSNFETYTSIADRLQPNLTLLAETQVKAQKQFGPKLKL